ncbi:Hypothetical predicted protein, partial [Paramuricea clavata]
MASFQVQPPEKFTFKPEDWLKWSRRFERFRMASGLEKESEESQVNTLIYSMGSEADEIVQSLSIAEGDQKKYDVVKKKLEDFFITKRNVIFERAKFNLRSQQEGETVDVFITDLFNLAEHCNFGVLREELIRDRIVVGIREWNNGLGELEGEYEIKLKELPEPFALNVPRKVPFPMLDKTKKEIERMLKIGVISKVDQPTVWCAPMVVTPKQNGEVRICVDLTKLNKSVLREAYPLPSVDFTLGKLSKSKALGHVISSEGVSPDSDKVKAILDIPVPTNVAEVDLSWKCLISVPILALYDPNKETKINADASSYGIGGVVLQKQENNEWKPVSYISRALTDTESRYSQIEKECLAFTWACERSSDYILGKSFSGETDHKPLVPLLTTHTLDQIPPRIQRFRMRLMRFNLEKMTHVPGKQMYTSDALSRLLKPFTKPDCCTVPEDDMNAFVETVINSLPVSDKKLKEIIEAQEEDEVCKKVKQYCLEGWPDKHMVPDAVKSYWRERGELTVVQSLIMKGTRILIPSCMRLNVLDKIHEGHLGITKCRERAKQS